MATPKALVSSLSVSFISLASKAPFSSDNVLRMQCLRQYPPAGFLSSGGSRQAPPGCINDGSTPSPLAPMMRASLVFSPLRKLAIRREASDGVIAEQAHIAFAAWWRSVMAGAVLGFLR